MGSNGWLKGHMKPETTIFTWKNQSFPADLPDKNPTPLKKMSDDQMVHIYIYVYNYITPKDGHLSHGQHSGSTEISYLFTSDDSFLQPNSLTGNPQTEEKNTEQRTCNHYNVITIIDSTPSTRKKIPSGYLT